MNNDPCETCLRWPECNGADAKTCPLCNWENNKLKDEPAALGDVKERGLQKED